MLDSTLIKSIKYLEILAKKSNSLRDFLNFIIDLYEDSPNFNQADIRFDLIMEYLDEFSEDQLKNLLDKASNNTQCYNRGRSSGDHIQVEVKIKTYDKDYELPSNLK